MSRQAISCINRGALFAVPFNLTALEVTGSPFPLQQQVRVSNLSGWTQYAILRKWIAHL